MRLNTFEAKCRKYPSFPLAYYSQELDKIAGIKNNVY